MTGLHAPIALRGFALAVACVFVGSIAGAQPSQGQDPAKGTPPPLPAPQLVGRWDLNVQASDAMPSAEPQPGQGDEGRRDGSGGGGGRDYRGGGGGRRGGEWSSRPADKPESAAVRQEMDRALEAPRFYVIVQKEDVVILTDNDGRVTTLKPDGSKVTEQQAGGTIERTTRWDDRALVTTAKLSNGAKITQTFTKVFDGLQLVIVTRIQGGQYRKPLEIKRVYDQAFQ